MNTDKHKRGAPDLRTAAARGAANAFGWLGRILGVTKPSKLRQWQRRVKEMQGCKSAEELVARFGEPRCKLPQAGFEIWHYPLGMERGMNYSAHVSVWGHGARQVYLYFEPARGG